MDAFQAIMKWIEPASYKAGGDGELWQNGMAPETWFIRPDTNPVFDDKILSPRVMSSSMWTTNFILTIQVFISSLIIPSRNRMVPKNLCVLKSTITPKELGLFGLCNLIKTHFRTPELLLTKCNSGN